MLLATLLRACARDAAISKWALWRLSLSTVELSQRCSFSLARAQRTVLYLGGMARQRGGRGRVTTAATWRDRGVAIDIKISVTLQLALTRGGGW